tara:strand:+ start:296 stop:880 length:585 start_codon:yes stop_codon:yes gene_type:complete
MAVKFTKPEINVREKLAELDYYKVPFQKMPAGSVLQVKAVTLTGRYAVTSSSDTGVGTDIGLNISITPRSSSSAFLVTVNVGAAGSINASWGAIISRDGSRVGVGDTYGAYSAGVLFRGCWVGHVDYNHTQGGGSGQYLDTTPGTPGTPITYICGFGVQGGTLRINSDYNQYSGGAAFAHSTAVSTMTIMEIAQ